MELAKAQEQNETEPLKRAYNVLVAARDFPPDVDPARLFPKLAGQPVAPERVSNGKLVLTTEEQAKSRELLDNFNGARRAVANAESILEPIKNLDHTFNLSVVGGADKLSLGLDHVDRLAKAQHQLAEAKKKLDSAEAGVKAFADALLPEITPAPVKTAPVDWQPALRIGETAEAIQGLFEEHFTQGEDIVLSSDGAILTRRGTQKLVDNQGTYFGHYSVDEFKTALLFLEGHQILVNSSAPGETPRYKLGPRFSEITERTREAFYEAVLLLIQAHETPQQAESRAPASSR